MVTKLTTFIDHILTLVNFFISFPSRCRLVTNSFEELLAFQRALKEFVGSADPVYSKQYEEFFVGLEGRQVVISLDCKRET